ncbi:hypothetical protein [Acinetobacter bereziniae]|uniref:hypothetical protein n=1 Tax=Acinetobacter bereziniae TaxID=106648 RepID=UPI000EF6DF8F|nr:hypothetical protein [Acinetobacter bereziniae]
MTEKSTKENSNLLNQECIVTKGNHDISHHLHKQSIRFYADLPNSDASIYPYEPIQTMISNTVALTTNDQVTSQSNPSHQHTNQETIQSVSPQLSLKHQGHELCEATPQPMLKFALQASAFFRHSLISLCTKPKHHHLRNIQDKSHD